MLDEVCAEGKQTESREKMVKRWIDGEFVERGDKKKGGDGLCGRELVVLWEINLLLGVRRIA